MGNLIVYKASAGSGKTFTLTVEYIIKLINNPRAYRNILAVTFANKATAEMKERILSQLYGIANNDKDSKPYLDKIKESIQDLSDDTIRSKAKQALNYILHDYNHFRVETIDSFFQTVMHNLARELGLAPNLNIELDSQLVLNDAVDIMFANLTAKSKEMIGILDYIEQRISEDRKWRIADEVKKFGVNLFKETVMNYGESLSLQLGDENHQKDFRHQLMAIKKSIENDGKLLNERFQTALQNSGITVSDINRGSSIEGYFAKLAEGNMSDKNVGTTVSKCFESPEGWIKAKGNNLLDIISSTFFPLLKEAEDFRSKSLMIQNSIDLTLQHLNEIALLSAIQQEIIKSNKERNRFLLAETNTLLHKLIKDDDSSFVFEKIGASIENVMIDEFQDTSKMQWENFKMLLIQGLSQGADSYIVGDVKQSIYRWRNGDWAILNNLRGKIMGADIEERKLDTNRRSEKNIIEFNNATFTNAVRTLNDLYKSDREDKEDCIELINAYKDVKQNSPSDETKGYIKVSFLEEDKENEMEYDDVVCAKLAEEVVKLQDKGVQLNDMAILVRKNNRIPIIADYFKENLDISVISDEAFQLCSSSAICILINALRFLSDENDIISLVSIMNDYRNLILKENINISELGSDKAASYINQFYNQRNKLRLFPLYELLENLFDLFELDKLDGQDDYLYCFFDSVNEYISNNASDIQSFLDYWDETLFKQTVTGGKIDGLHIFSIHKSKGLEFHTVLIPFCDWNLENETNDQLIWCNPKVEPFNELQIIPINYGQKMFKSAYRDDYLKERLQLWVDNLNLLYVAFTRAEKNLIILGKKKKETKNGSDLMKTVSNLLQNVLSQQLDDHLELEIGECLPSQTKEKKITTNKFLETSEELPIKIKSYNHKVEFKQSNNSSDFIYGKDEEDTYHRFIDRGKVLHELFSKINSKDDIDKAIDLMIFNGVIDKDEKEEIQTFIHKAFELPEVQEWYTPDWELLNERSIIWEEDGEILNRRPDRVMIKGDNVVVIDFKFGQKEERYKSQVLSYINLLSKIGYKNINGYLWYAGKSEIERVN